MCPRTNKGKLGEWTDGFTVVAVVAVAAVVVLVVIIIAVLGFVPKKILPANSFSRHSPYQTSAQLVRCYHPGFESHRIVGLGSENSIFEEKKVPRSIPVAATIQHRCHFRPYVANRPKNQVPCLLILYDPITCNTNWVWGQCERF